MVLVSQFSGGWARTFKKFFFSFEKQGKAVYAHAALLLSQCLSLGARVLGKQSFHVSPAKVKLPESRFSLCLSQKPVLINWFKVKQLIL